MLRAKAIKILNILIPANFYQVNSKNYITIIGGGKLLN